MLLRRGAAVAAGGEDQSELNVRQSSMAHEDTRVHPFLHTREFTQMQTAVRAYARWKATLISFAERRTDLPMYLRSGAWRRCTTVSCTPAEVPVLRRLVTIL